MNNSLRTIALTGIAASIAVTGSIAGLGTNQAQAASTTSTTKCTQGVDAKHFSCEISGTTDQGSVTLPLTASPGVVIPAGTYPMRSGAGTMTITATSVTFTFNQAFLDTHAAPYSFAGGFDFAVDTFTVANDFSVDVAGDTFNVTNSGDCGSTCQGRPVTGTWKAAWDKGRGTVGFSLVRGNESVVVGQPVTFTDQAGAGQFDCTAAVFQQNSALRWEQIGTASSTGTLVTATVTPAHTGAVKMEGQCKVDGSQQYYQDNGTIDGVKVTAKTPVSSAWATGTAARPVTPTPQLPPTPVTPTPPTPAPKPKAPAPKPKATPVKMVTETYQIDVATIRNSNWTINKYLAADDDSRLVYRELGGLWKNQKLRKHFSEKHEFVTITVPANATQAQRIKAINAKSRLGDVRTTAKAGRSTAKSGTFVYAWKLDTARGARPTVSGGLAWGPKHNLAQTFMARS